MAFVRFYIYPKIKEFRVKIGAIREGLVFCFFITMVAGHNNRLQPTSKPGVVTFAGLPRLFRRPAFSAAETGRLSPKNFRSLFNG